MKKLIIILVMFWVLVGCEYPDNNKYSEAWVDSDDVIWIAKDCDSMAKNTDNGECILHPESGYNINNYETSCLSSSSS